MVTTDTILSPGSAFAWYGDDIAKAMQQASLDALKEIARRVRNEAGERSPYDTGHNAASIAVVPDDRRVLYRKQPKMARGPFNDPARHARKGRVAIATSSGYGGPLETNARGARFTTKAKGKGGAKGSRHLTLGRRGAQYMQRGLAAVMANAKFMKEAILLATNARIKRQQARIVRSKRISDSKRESQLFGQRSFIAGRSTGL